MKAFRYQFVSALLISALISSTQAAEVVIDDFSTTPQSGNGYIDGGGILGGERDAIVNGSNLLNISGGSAVMSLPVGQAGSFIILQYDGNDSDSLVSYTLGPVDVTDGGSNDRVYLGVSAVTGSVSFLISLRESSSITADDLFDIDHTGVYELPLNTLPATAPPPDFTSIDHIVIRFIMDPGESITINKFTVGPDPLLFENGFESE